MLDKGETRADFWTGLFWIAFGAVLVAASAGMPIPRHLGATVLTGPGLVPGALGGALVLLGATLMLRAWRGRVVESAEGPVDPETVSTLRPLVACAMMVAYAWALTERGPFVPLTVVFITLFVTAFNWQGRSMAGRARTVAAAAVMAIAIAFLLRFVFETLFFVRLP